MKIKLKQVNLIIFVVLASVILISMLFLEPIRYGDGNEYFLMLESLSNHLSPDLRQEDINDFYNGEFNAFGEKINPYSGYFESKNHKWYSYHFWAYSVSAVPVKLTLELFKLDTRKAFQITNALLFISALAVINFVSRFKEKQKMLFMLLLTFSPALWLIHWTHAEIFMLSFVTISLVFLNLEKYGIAIIFAAIASFQNQALVLFVLFLLIKAVLSSKYEFKSLLKYGALSLLIFLPNLFYLINFGKFSLLSDITSITYISVLRIFEMFFDLNIGLFPYIPLSLLFFFGIIIFKTYKKRTFTYESQILLLIIAMMVICSMTYNWNHDTTGPTRYVVWILPFIFFIIIKNINLIFNNKILKYIFISGIILQLFIVIGFGPFVPTLSYLDHTPAAQAALNHFPEFYNPSDEIFCERTMHRESNCLDPTIYTHNDKCKKALLTCNGLDELQSLCDNTPKDIEDYCKQKNKNWFYVNYK